MDSATIDNLRPDGTTANVVPASAIFDFGSDATGGGNGGDSGQGGSGGNFDPAAPLGYKADGTPRKRRGRKPGSAAGIGGQKASRVPAVDAIAGTLYSIHGLLAAAVAPELMLSEDEANKLAKATAQVAEVSNWDIDPRALAWSNLTMTAIAIYGPRALHIYARVQYERRRKTDGENKAAPAPA